MGTYSLPLQVNGMTDEERREFLLWMATSRASQLRDALRTWQASPATQRLVRETWRDH